MSWAAHHCDHVADHEWGDEPDDEATPSRRGTEDDQPSGHL